MPDVKPMKHGPGLDRADGHEQRHERGEETASGEHDGDVSTAIGHRDGRACFKGSG